MYKLDYGHSWQYNLLSIVYEPFIQFQTNAWNYFKQIEQKSKNQNCIN